MSELKIVRLQSGADLLGQVEDLGDFEYRIDRPLVVRFAMPEPTENNPNPNPSIGLAPYLFPYIAQDFIQVKTTIRPMDVVPEVSNKYREVFGMIVVPESRIIMP